MAPTPPLPRRRPPRRGAAEQQRLRLARPDGHRADRADGDACLRDAAVGNAHPHGDGRGRPLAEGQLAVRDAGARRRRRHADRDEQIALVRARSRYGPSMNSPSGRTRAGSPPRRSTTSAPAASRNVAGSECGSPKQRLPPSVPAVRTRMLATDALHLRQRRNLLLHERRSARSPGASPPRRSRRRRPRPGCPSARGCRARRRGGRTR